MAAGGRPGGVAHHGDEYCPAPGASAGHRGPGCRGAPALADALRTAEIDFEHAFRIGVAVADERLAELVIARADEVLGVARQMRADRFRQWLDEWARRNQPDDGVERDEALHATRFVRSRKADDGMIEGRFRLDPIDGRTVIAGIDRIVDEERRIATRLPGRTHRRQRADAWSRSRPGRDAATARRCPGWAPSSTTTTSPASSRPPGRCELDDGTPLPASSGAPPGLRSRRSSPSSWATTACHSTSAANTAPPPGPNGSPSEPATTPVPGRRVSGRSMVQVHHLIPWQYGGPTDLDNLVPLCTYHHGWVHEAMWPVTREPDGRLVVHDYVDASLRAAPTSHPTSKQPAANDTATCDWNLSAAQLIREAEPARRS